MANDATPQLALEPVAKPLALMYDGTVNLERRY